MCGYLYFAASLTFTFSLLSGHNWGSPHDPASCAPGVFDGGKYLMYQYSVSGFDPNNNVSTFDTELY